MVVIVDDCIVYGQGLVDEFKKVVDVFGLKIVVIEYMNDKVIDFKVILIKIKFKKVELVFFGGMDVQGGLMVKQMKELGIKVKFFGGDGVCMLEFMKLGGEVVEGNYCLLFGMLFEKLVKGFEFKEKFVKKFGVEIQFYVLYVYDVVMVMVDLMKCVDLVELVKFLLEVGKIKYDGVIVLIEFDLVGDFKGGVIFFYQYKGGKLEYVEIMGGGVGEVVKSVMFDVKDVVQVIGEVVKLVVGVVVEVGKEVVKVGVEVVKIVVEVIKVVVEKK